MCAASCTFQIYPEAWPSPFPLRPAPPINVSFLRPACSLPLGALAVFWLCLCSQKEFQDRVMTYFSKVKYSIVGDATPVSVFFVFLFIIFYCCHFLHIFLLLLCISFYAVARARATRALSRSATLSIPLSFAQTKPNLPNLTPLSQPSAARPGARN